MVERDENHPSSKNIFCFSLSFTFDISAGTRNTQCPAPNTLFYADAGFLTLDNTDDLEQLVQNLNGIALCDDERKRVSEAEIRPFQVLWVVLSPLMKLCVMKLVRELEQPG